MANTKSKKPTAKAKAGGGAGAGGRGGTSAGSGTKRKPKTKPKATTPSLAFEPLEAEFAREIVPVAVTEELSDSFLSYALSVITARAIPDIRDGLKPAQRRLLYAMLRMGIRPDTPHRKCARVVGETMGKFHPHGDAALYEALVRLGQDFARNFCLVDPQGNFGSLDDPPAASRYTECRLSEPAMALLAEIDEDTVAFRPTYDGEAQEPVCLPSRLPNLLVNGSVGIAVGMATNMLPHNIGETLEAAVKVLDGLPLARSNSSAQPMTEKVLGLPAKKLLKLKPEQLAEIEPAEWGALGSQRSAGAGGNGRGAGSGRNGGGGKNRSQPDVDELLKLMPGPDLPSGGVIIDDAGSVGATGIAGGLREIAETGRGALRIRSKQEIIAATRKRQAIVVTELPWQVGPEKVVARIKTLMAEDKLPEVMDVRNFTDRQHGLRIQIDCRAGVDANRVLHKLFKMTPLETSFTVNNVVLLDGVPVTASLGLLLEQFVYHRLTVVVRRTHFRRQRDLARQEIVAGFLLALDRIDEVVAIIRASKDVAQARQQLCRKIGLSETQAEAVLELRLRRLTALERDKLAAEMAELTAAIAGYDKLLLSDTELRKVVRDELRATAEEFPRERRSEIMRAEDLAAEVAEGEEGELEDGVAAAVAAVAAEPCVVTLSANGYLGRASPDDPAKKNTRTHDVLAAQVATSTDSYVWGITSLGRVLPVLAGTLSEVKAVSRGSLAGKLFGLSGEEQVLAVVGGEGDPTLMLVSAAGLAKRVELAGLVSSGIKAREVFTLAADDRLVTAEVCAGSDELAMVSQKGMVLRTQVGHIPVKSAASKAVVAMKLRAGDEVIGAGCFKGQAAVMAVGEKALAKAIATDELPSQNRGGLGIKFMPTTPEKLQFCRVGELADFLAVSAESEGVPEALANLLEVSKRNWKARATASQITHIGKPRWHKA